MGRTTGQGVVLQTEVLPPAPIRLVGRADLLASVEVQLAAGGSVVLTGSSGIGKTAIVDALGAAATLRGERVLRVAGAETERWISFAGLADLLSQMPEEYVTDLPEPQRAAVNSVLLRGRSAGSGSRVRLARRLAWHGLLERCAEVSPVLILIDDAQWLDAASADVIAFAARRTAGLRIRAVVAERWPERDDETKVSEPDDGSDPDVAGDLESGHWRVLLPRGRSHPAASLAPPPVTEIAVPPLEPADLAELLDLYALPARAASKLHADSGGNPYLALALGGAFADRTSAVWRPAPLPQRIHVLLQDRVGALPVEVRETLLVAALATRPTVELLLRAGRADADHDIRLAAAAGLLVTDGSVVRFTPPAVATVVAESATAAHRSAVHTGLSTVVTDAVERARHRALAAADPDAEVARSIVTAAENARRRGARALAAELYLLGAERTPAELDAERLEWLVSAAELGAAASRPEIVNRAAEAVIEADSLPAHRVRVRIALIDLSGQALAEMDETFAAAMADADGAPELMAPLYFRLAWQAMIEGNPMRGEAEADKAVSLAHSVGDTTTEAMALAIKAQVSRVLGRRDYLSFLDDALALPQPELDGWLHLTPRYQAVRFALFDDRLDEARADLFRMLALVERGEGEELVGVLRSLAEVSAQAGRCRDSLDFAGRAIRVAQEAGLSPGPVWYTGAIAELAGGSLARASAYAERGCRASEQEQDSIHLGRNLHALGQVMLRSGEVRIGVETLRRVRDLEAAQGIYEPTMLRWHADLASGLVAIGELDEAEETIRSAREGIVNRTYHIGVTARLDRAEALLHAERGESEAGAALLAEAVQAFDELGQPIERGHTLLVLSQIERRRRRYAAARAAATEALAVLTRIGAKPWIEQAVRTLAWVDGTSVDAPAVPKEPSGALAALTATEARIATMVREGASNREIATRMFLSVKTVEATLTRIYRKLGVRSRTQLSSRLGAD
jgi:DNA-binding CsgD family transcriptional regulator/tetratricopeptide (TPR) repeat protein/energy-coupling factor transporter ATP-binding protein EcfA2